MPKRPTLRLFVSTLALILAACGAPTAITPTTAPLAAPTATSNVNLSGVKQYLLEKSAALKVGTAKTKASADRYYELARAANFDYAALWKNQRAAVQQAIEQTRGDWIITSPLYEQMEGIVAGTPSLSQYDVILDAGASGAEGGDNVAPFDLKLPDGGVLPKPGNLFGLTESALWGTFPAYTVPNIQADFNRNGKPDFGESLPDANVLKGGVDALDSYAGQLQAAAQSWQPTEAEAFGALAQNVPTVSDFFEAWKDSRFVAGNTFKRRDFVVVSRLSDIIDNVSSWQVLYQSLSPAVRTADPARDTQIGKGLGDLRAYVSDLYAQEQGGKHFTPEEADLLSAEAQNRATAITGQITQVAALLNVKLEQ